MKFSETPITGCFEIALNVHEDRRGYFARVFEDAAFAQHGLTSNFCQTSVAFNNRKGTLRGMHWQEAPHQEAKLVRCIRGSVYDVVVDLRPESPSFRCWFATSLNQGSGIQLYVPNGCAHGYQTLTDGSELLYQISAPYVPEAARGLRWDDPSFAFRWPLPIAEISDRDRSFRDYAE
jgi:dTDP-4-dehydrorhamnose 3,5-epimerase